MTGSVSGIRIFSLTLIAMAPRVEHTFPSLTGPLLYSSMCPLFLLCGYLCPETVCPHTVGTVLDELR